VTKKGGDVEETKERRYATPRRGYAISVLDALIDTLQKRHGAKAWPEKSFSELHSAVSARLGRQINPAAIRGIIYVKHALFERANDARNPKWRLTRTARRD